MPFGVMSGVGRGMGVLDQGRDRRRGRGDVGSKCGASHCNQWGLCGVVVLWREGWRRSSSHVTWDFMFLVCLKFVLKNSENCVLGLVHAY